MVAESWMNPPPGVKCTTKVEDIISAKEGACDTDSGYSWFSIDLPPDVNEIKSMCQSASCLVMFETIKPAAPTECVTKTGWYLYADLLNPILKGCDNVTKPSTTGEAPYNSSTPSGTTTIVPAPTSPVATTTTVVTPTVTPVWVAASPVVTTAPPVADAGAQIVDSALSRGTIIAILSASVVVLTTITGLVKFCYKRRQQKKGGGLAVLESPSATPRKPGYRRGGRDEDDEDDE